MSQLVNGLIPVHTPCPFREQCSIAKANHCYHKGERHEVPYSCAAARGFDIIERGKQGRL